MKRYLKYIFLALTATLMAVSCIEELKPETPVFQKDALTLVPRVQSFANQYVTKANDSIDETSISALGVLVFNEDGELVHYQENASTNQNKLTLYKSLINSSAQEGKLDNATIVLFANMTLSDLKNGSQTVLDKIKTNTLTLADMENYIYSPSSDKTVITPDEENFTGFPMIGGTSADLSSGSSAEVQEVTLNMLYTKVRFNIAVTQSSENQGTGMKFELTGCTVHNTANSIPLAIPVTYGKQPVDFLGRTIPNSEPAEGDGTTLSSIYNTEQDGISIDATGTATFSNNSNSDDDEIVEFTFYVLESRYNHNGLDGVYPWNDWFTSEPAEDVKNYNAATDDAKRNGVKYFYDDLIQQYKPKLAEGGKATYVELNGTYTDYRGTAWDVDYTIYLGKDNAQNFQVDRNSEYINYISIKGIRNNNSYGDFDVWIDHRVGVTYNGEYPESENSRADDCVTITRETLIDSHIEVRPLRVKWGKDTNGKDLYTFARIYLPYYTEDAGKTWAQRDEETSKNWIGIELGDKTGSLYCTGDNNPSKGKRKYFTETLVSELNNSSENTDIVSSGGDKFIALANDQCAWIYIDEYWNDESAATNPATMERKAKIIVDFCSLENNNIKVKNREEYILFQQPLINIDDKYYIENYEEYLHSYDSHDKYNIETSPTDYSGQGLQWGYTQTGANRVSKSQFVTKMPLSQWTDWTPNNSEAYDFIHSKDVEANEALSGYKIVDKDGNDIDLAKNTGYGFTFTASKNNGVTISSMDKMPESAYQYCLSKNKFDEGTGGQDNKMLVRWYVPDVYELSDIFLSEESPLSKESYYWSSQSPYKTGQSSFFSADIASEVVEQARLVSKNGGIGSKSRSEKHRIRCLYNRNGEIANMEDRTPEGIGGLIKIPMTVKDNGYFNHSPWFTNLGKIGKGYPDPLPSYRFPKGDTDASTRAEADKDFGGTILDGVHYYSKDPLSENVWAAENDYMQSNGYYTLVHEDKWPGLTSKETTPITDSKVLEYLANLLGISSICTLSENDKIIQRSETTRSGAKIESMPNDINDVPLDHNEASGSNLTISFDKGTNSSNIPKYEYYNEDGTAARQMVWVKYWNVPTYTEHLNISGSVKKNITVSSSIYRDYDEGDIYMYENTYYKITEKHSSGLIIRKYYFDLGPIDGYKYVADTGGWGDEKPLSDKPVSIEPEKPNVDALTFYAGNTFTISCTKENYFIKSVKVNYNTSKIGDTKYLRFVDNSKALPAQDQEPLQMRYLDGANGWSKWTSEGDDASITLRMVISDKPEPSIWNWWNPKATHKDPSYSSEYNYSLIINSLEIRLEEKK